ncbi:hypothetical protein ACPCI1_25760 [Streptomyces seoulensis]|uniref:hypothetical protein n=1 Tax=Streptomyces seoulensis TaxID=73044 RepID=UPI003C30B9C1
MQGTVPGAIAFRQHGHNPSRKARMVWQAVGHSPSILPPVEAVATVTLPEVYSPTEAPAVATITIDVMSRIQQYMKDRRRTQCVHRYPVPALACALDGLLRAAVDCDVIAELSRITDIDVLVAQPGQLHLVTNKPVVQLLRDDGLLGIPGVGGSRGGIFLSDPAPNLRDGDELQEQVDDWLCQLGLDAGLTGMEALAERFRAAEAAA